MSGLRRTLRAGRTLLAGRTFLAGRTVLAGLALVLAVLAVGAALLANDLRAWRDAFARDDAVFALSPAAPGWQATTVFPFGAAASLLGVAGARQARLAIQGFRSLDGVEGTLDTGSVTQSQRAAVEQALAAVTAGPDRRRASQASDLLGILAFGDIAQGGTVDQGQAEACVSAFENAVRLDPTNASAKLNLELVLRLFSAQGVRVGPGTGAGIDPTGKRGAGGGTPGSGY